VIVVLNTGLQERKIRNLAVLETIVKIVLLCSRHNLALRGHRDDSQYTNDKNINTGNVSALLRYRVDGGDELLQEHFNNAPSNATYISKTTQNEVISIIGDSIQRSIVNDCNEAGGWFSLSADEVRDTANNEQLAVTLRYVDKEKNIKENFLSFRDVSADTSGESLSKELLTFVDEAGLDRMKMHSQCYDGAGKVKGLGPRIQKQLPKALPFWCTAYQLNRCIIQACNIPSVRNMICTADLVVKFFEYSPKKQTVHEKLIDETVKDETSRTKLKQLCRTRWVEKHDAFSVFLDFFPAIVQTLEHFAKLPNTRTPGAADATFLLYSICNFEFVVLLLLYKCAWLV
jgi:hypothetical protein